MNIILMGMKHCGKTSVGNKISEDFNIPYFDLDDLIIDQYKREYLQLKTVEDIFRDEGASVFYRIEAFTFNHFCKHEANLHEKFVLSLGGRTPLNPLIGGSLEQCGYLIYINTPFEFILERIIKKGKSVLIKGENPKEYIEELYNLRHPVYMKKASWVVDGKGDIPAITGRIKKQIEELTNGR